MRTEGIVYGPMRSRRLGRSLGIDITPAGCRVCNFQCVYCLYPRQAGGRRPRWPTPEQVAACLRAALPRAGALDSITISGHGEPTLHPRFPEVVDAILGEARRQQPEVPVRILTNGSGAVFPAIRAALDRLDERIVKLDAEPEGTSGRKSGYGAILFGLLGLRDVTLQSCFFEGSGSNSGDESIEEWAALVAEVQPRAVQIYTIDRDPAQSDARPLAQARLARIAQRLKARTGIEARGASRRGAPPLGRGVGIRSSAPV